MKVLVACEFSGIVRDAFRAKGHDAWSCDYLPTEIPGQHFQGDIIKMLSRPWDMVIAHPPCTFLASSGLHWNKRIPGREELTELAIEFALMFLNLPVLKIAVENPIGILSTRIRKPDQIIQPWMFGHPESKATCLWLKGLPLLTPTKIANFKRYKCRCGYVFEEHLGKYGCPNCGEEHAARPLWDNQTKSGQNKLPPSEDRWKDRSRTYRGIADAMAEQWG